MTRLYHIFMIEAMEKQKGMACIYRFDVNPVGPWQSGLLRRIYTPVKRVRARSEGPNPSGPAILC